MFKNVMPAQTLIVFTWGDKQFVWFVYHQSDFEKQSSGTSLECSKFWAIQSVNVHLMGMFVTFKTVKYIELQSVQV